MNLLFLLGSLSRANGGVSESVRRLAQSLVRRDGVQVGVFGLQDDYYAEDIAAWSPVPAQGWPVSGPRAFGYAPGLSGALARSAAEAIHVAGLWMYPSLAHRRQQRRARRPYMISPHGMLDAWALRNSAWKKQIAAVWFERAHLAGASCLHALCEPEYQAIRAYGLTNPVCVIPNGVDLPDPAAPARSVPWPADGRKTMLFLGRLHPKKGLVPLVQAWRAANDPRWRLVIAGWDQGGHQAELQALVESWDLAGSVLFTGPLHGVAKQDAYRAADAFILPSFSEGLPMTVLEAWSFAKPVLMTEACNLPAGFSAGAAVRIEAVADRLAGQLSTFFSMGEAETARRGRAGRALVEQSFAWPQVARQMAGVYAWMCAGGTPPPEVRLG